MMVNFIRIISYIAAPATVIFGIIAAGIAIGKIRIFGLCLGYSGVLMVALSIGWISSFSSVLSGVFINADINNVYSILSSVGTAVFVASVGLEAGKTLSKKKSANMIKAFLGGVSTVIVGAAVCCIFFLFRFSISREFIIGIFSGAMTSTPALQLASEICSNTADVVAGYGASYPIGLIFVVLFVQAANPQRNITEIFEENAQTDSPKEENALLIISLVVFSGMLLNAFISIGTTASILACAILLGYVISKKTGVSISTQNIGNFGLVLFFVGTGIPAGIEFSTGVPLISFFIGAAISFSAVLIGYALLRYVFDFSKNDGLAIISGGMTSTPAIGALCKRNNCVDYSLFAISYTGALTALFASVYVLSYLT